MSLDAAALSAAWERHRGSIYRHVLRLVRTASDAEDLTQETFLRAYRSADTLEDETAVGAWLYQIATRACYDFFRRSARSPTDLLAGANTDAVQADTPAADTVFERIEMNECGEELLDRLPESYRRVLLLHDLAGMTSTEIARLLDCSIGSVKVRLHRARSRFRAELTSACEFYRNERGALVGARKKTASK